MKNSYNLTPLEELLHEEDPLEIARYLDDMMLVLVQHSDNDGYLPELSHRYYILRVLRNVFSACTESPADKTKTTRSTGDGN